MIKYNLKCKCKKTFESWFSSSSEFDNLKKKKLISCIYCNSTKVEKSLMAPNLSSKSNKNIKKNKLEKKFKNELYFSKFKFNDQSMRKSIQSFN